MFTTCNIGTIGGEEETPDRGTLKGRGLQQLARWVGEELDSREHGEVGGGRREEGGGGGCFTGS